MFVPESIPGWNLEGDGDGDGDGDAEGSRVGAGDSPIRLAPIGAVGLGLEPFEVESPGDVLPVDVPDGEPPGAERSEDSPDGAGEGA